VGFLTLISSFRFKGLDYAHARYYQPGFGRFMSVDPLAGDVGDPQSLNLYSYVRNNPINFIDPTGMGSCPPDDPCPPPPPSAGFGRGPGPIWDIVPRDEGGRWTLRRQPPTRTEPQLRVAISGMGKVTANTFIEINNLVNGLVDLAISPFTDFAFGQLDEFQPSSPAEAEVMASTEIGLAIVPIAGAAVRGVAVGNVIKGFTKHGINQAISRDGVGVSGRAILEAVRNPVSRISQGGGRTMYVGRDATVVVNSSGRVITTWATTRAGTRIP
jgi:RHS repeat-associated protein